MTSSPKATPSSSSGWNPRISPQSSTVGGTPTHSMTEHVSPDMRGKKPMSLDPNRYDPTLDAKLALLADVHCRLTQDMSAFTSNFQHALCELGRTFESGFQGLGSAQAAQATTQACRTAPWWTNSGNPVLPARFVRLRSNSLFTMALVILNHGKNRLTACFARIRLTRLRPMLWPGHFYIYVVVR